MHAVTGPYAHEIFEHEVGASAGTLRNGTPLPDFTCLPASSRSLCAAHRGRRRQA